MVFKRNLLYYLYVPRLHGPMSKQEKTLIIHIQWFVPGVFSVLQITHAPKIPQAALKIPQTATKYPCLRRGYTMNTKPKSPLKRVPTARLHDANHGREKRFCPIYLLYRA